MTQSTARPLPRMSATGLGLALAGIVMGVWRSVRAIQAGRNWLDNRTFDPSAAELDAISFWLNLGAILFAVGLTWVGRRMIRRGQAV